MGPISAREVNRFIADASGADISAKDFRTFRASAEALAILTEHRKGESLVNTRSVARSRYIHPGVIKAYKTGK